MAPISVSLNIKALEMKYLNTS